MARTKALVDVEVPDAEQTDDEKQAYEDRATQIEEQEADQKAADEAAAKAADKATKDAPDPQNPDDLDKFNSHLARDTTHFQNVHYTEQGAVDTITGASSADRVMAANALLAATGHNVNASTGWDDATRAAVLAYQGEGGSGEMDRETWNKLSDDLFDEGKGKDSRSKHGPEPKPVPATAAKK